MRAGLWGGERGREVNSVGSLLMDGSREMTALSAYWMWNVERGHWKGTVALLTWAAGRIKGRQRW